MTDATTITVETANAQLSRVFAPWVTDLQPRVESIGGESVVMRMPWSERLCRSHDMVCGQAMMALVDTCMVFVCYIALHALARLIQPLTDKSPLTAGLRPG